MMLPDPWQALLHPRLPPAWCDKLNAFLAAEAAAGKTIYPPEAQRFAALEAVPPQAVRVVILGQDPYHGAGQAHGLSFSVPHGVRLPPSLHNIFREIQRDLGHPLPTHGNLSAWARQGVLLLNSVLTVEAERAGSHRQQGWETLTDVLIATLAEQGRGLVFLLWGAFAQSKARLIDPQRHRVLSSPHPSPLSAYRGFIGNGHFSATNTYLLAQGHAPIDWRLG